MLVERILRSVLTLRDDLGGLSSLKSPRERILRSSLPMRSSVELLLVLLALGVLAILTVLGVGDGGSGLLRDPPLTELVLPL